MESWASTCLLLAGEFLVWDVSRQVGVQHSAEGQAVIPAAAEVGDVNVLKKQVHKLKKKVPRDSTRVRTSCFYQSTCSRDKAGRSGRASLVSVLTSVVRTS